MSSGSGESASAGIDKQHNGTHPPPSGRMLPSRLGWAAFACALGAALAAAGTDPGAAGRAASQDWPAFVLVAGLLLVGTVAGADGVFAWTGRSLGRIGGNNIAVYASACLLIAAVTAVLNLDTSVAFLTPVLIHLSRSRRSDDAPLLYVCLFMSNGASLLLPGSNLTNLIVLGHLHLSGGSFAAHMAPAFAASVVTTALVVALFFRRRLSTPRGSVSRADAATPRVLGVLCALAVTVLVLVLHSPAVWVAAIGAGAVAIRVAQGRESPREVVQTVGPRALVGLFAVSVALGTLGRAWNGPYLLLIHLDSWATAAVAAVVSVLVNNLPAASLLAAKVPPRPFSLLVGLNLGPNLFVTGSLSALIWLRAATRAGASPSIAQVARLGAVVVPVSIAAAVGALALGGHA